MYTLKIKSWWDYGEDSCVFFIIYNDDKKIFESSWYDCRLLCEDNGYYNEMRTKLKLACEKLGLKLNDNDIDYYNWSITEKG